MSSQRQQHSKDKRIIVFLQILVNRDECAERIDGESMKIELVLHNVLPNTLQGMFHLCCQRDLLSRNWRLSSFSACLLDSGVAQKSNATSLEFQQIAITCSTTADIVQTRHCVEKGLKISFVRTAGEPNVLFDPP